MLRVRLLNRFKYMMERMLDGSPLGQLLLVGAIVLCIALTGGLLVYWFTPAGAISEEIWWSFLRLTDPGYLGDDEGLLRRSISTFLTVAGYVLFMGTLVAIMTQWLFRKMRQLEQGHTPINFSNHKVILGWNSRTLPILKELLEYGPKRGAESRIAVLADDITAGPVTELLNQPWRRSERQRIVLRSGTLLNPEHLHRVAVEQAATILIPRRNYVIESGLNSDADVMKLLLSLQTKTHHSRQQPHVVAELLDAHKIPLAQHTYKGPLQLVPSDQLIARILARSILYPGLLMALNALFLEPAQPLFKPYFSSRLEGKKWHELLSMFADAKPCGVVRLSAPLAQQSSQQHKVTLAPALDYELQAGEGLILLAHDASKLEFVNQTKPLLLPRQFVTSTQQVLPVKEQTTGMKTNKQRLLILGWNTRVPKMLKELAQQASGPIEAVLISTLSATERQQYLTDYLGSEWPGTTLCLEGDYANEDVLARIQLYSFQAVFVFSSDRLNTGEEADTRSLVAFMQLDYLLNEQRQGRIQPQILLELHDQSNEVYVQHTPHDVLVSSIMIAHLLGQVALYPCLGSVYDNLLASQGAHIGIRYLPLELQQELSIAEIQEYLLAEEIILLGINLTGDKVELNPPAQQRFCFGPQSQLIVLGKLTHQ